jgi:hypothetical protein
MSPPDRDQALITIRDGDERLRRLFDRIPEDAFARRGTIGEGTWSAKDLLGHIASWEELGLATIGAWRRGERARLDGRSFDGDTDSFNAWNEERKHDWPLERVRTEAAETHRQLLAAIEAMGPEAWGAPRTFDDDRAPPDLGSALGGILGAADGAFRHAFAHLPDLETFVGSLGG